MAKTSDVRPKITLACTECKERNYITKKNRRNDPDRLELKKFCPRCPPHRAPRDPLTAAVCTVDEPLGPRRLRACRPCRIARARPCRWSSRADRAGPRQPPPRVSEAVERLMAVVAEPGRGADARAAYLDLTEPDLAAVVRSSSPPTDAVGPSSSRCCSPRLPRHRRRARSRTRGRRRVRARAVRRRHPRHRRRRASTCWPSAGDAADADALDPALRRRLLRRRGQRRRRRSRPRGSAARRGAGRAAFGTREPRGRRRCWPSCRDAGGAVRAALPAPPVCCSTRSRRAGRRARADRWSPARTAARRTGGARSRYRRAPAVRRAASR